MTVWIDPPLWPAHGTRWSHVISDASLEELHAFAAAAGIPRRSFEGDHYDVPAERHTEVVAAGARTTTGTDLARRLAASGLRFRKRRGEHPLARVRDGLPAVRGPHVLDVVASPHEPPADAGAAVVVLTEPGGQVLLVRSVGREGWTPPGGKRDLGEDVRTAAAREVAEETGLVLDPAALRTVGYERITIQAGAQLAPWDAGDNHIAVFGLRLPQAAPVAPAADDVAQAAWFARQDAERLAGDLHWWPLVARFLDADR